MLNIGTSELILIGIVFGVVIFIAVAIIYLLMRNTKKKD